jgi:NitT/TauT family transport system permease protein
MAVGGPAVSEAVGRWDGGEPITGQRRVRRRLGDRRLDLAVGTPLLALAALVAAWQLLSWRLGEVRMPAPSSVARALWDVLLHEAFFHHAQATLTRVVFGMLLSVTLALVVGMAMGLFRPVERFVRPYVVIGLTVPALATALIAVLVVGINNWAPIVTIVFTTAPVLTLNIWQGTKAIDRDLLAMSASFNASRWLTLRHVLLPQLVPYLLAGMRMGLSLAWKIVVLSEAFGLPDGVGHRIQVSFSEYSLRDVMAWTAGFALVMSLIEFAVFAPLERRLTRWRPRG